MKDIIIICSRIESSRLPNKAFLKTYGISFIDNLYNRLNKNFKVIMAIPEGQRQYYKFPNIYEGPHDDPLLRTYQAAIVERDVENIIRVTHDKVLIEPSLIEQALDMHKRENIDYTYLSGCGDGLGFEIVTMDCLRKAVELMNGKPTEFLSYAFRNVAEKIAPFYAGYQSDARFLLDYPEDYSFFMTLFGILGPNVRPSVAIAYLKKNPELIQINKLPEVTIYSCVYNGSKYINNCLNSIKEQCSSQFPGFFEVIILDDSSSDNSYEIIVKKALYEGGIKWMKNTSNNGLAASSNLV